jgi:hypothetical protein
MEFFMNLIKSISLALIALVASQSGLAMEKEPKDIFEAIEKHDLEAVKAFLDKGADINGVNSVGETPLLAACRAYCYATFPIEVIADENLKTRAKNFFKVVSSSGQVFEVTSDKRVVHAKDFFRASNGMTFDKSRVNNSGLIIQQLIQRGAYTDYADKDGVTPLIYICRATVAFNACKKLAKEVPIKLVKELLAHKASVNKEDKNGNTPLLCAIKTVCASGALDYDDEIIDELLKNGADVNYPNKNQPLMFAIQLELSRYYPRSWVPFNLIEKLLNAGACVNGALITEAKKGQYSDETISLLSQAMKKQEGQKLIEALKIHPLRFDSTDKELPPVVRALIAAKCSTSNESLEYALHNSWVLLRDKQVKKPLLSAVQINTNEEKFSWIEKTLTYFMSAWSDLGEAAEDIDEDNQ